MAHLWGIDLGGTKIEGVILDSAAPEKPVCRLRLDTDPERGYEAICERIVEVCQNMREETGLPWPKKIGMGTPGTTDPGTGRLKNSNTQCMNGQSLGRDVSARAGAEFVLANDANCLALAECTLGAGRGYPTVFGIIMGTGVGGGIVIDGKIVGGCHGIGGEWGQVIIEPDGPPSPHGTRGSIEALIAGPALESFYAEQAGTRRKLAEIVVRAETGDGHAAATLERLTSYFARALSVVVDILDPHAIIVGGGVGNIAALYTPATREKITAAIFNPTFEAALLRPMLGDSGGVFGAAMLVA